MSEVAPELLTGQLFAGWRVERELARGGMGVLYVAHHPRLPRTDVIKVLTPNLTADQRFRERFLREADRMSTLSHPHVMPIHDSGESPDGTLYLVMPFIAGGDLRGLLHRSGRLDPARAVRLIAQLGAALDAAHRVGVIHRDVKPENVMLSSVEPDEADHVLLTDFGISREQVLGKTTDARADRYALACILFELLTGNPPYMDEVPLVMLMARIRDSCKDTTGQLARAEQPYVITRATCTDAIRTRNLTVAYRSLRNNETAIKKYRGDVLQLGGTYSSPGNCQTLTSADPAAAQGRKGFAQGVNQKVIFGSVWCNRDGSLWYLQLNAAKGHPPVITELYNSIGSGKADAPQRFKDLEVVAPAP